LQSLREVNFVVNIIDPTITTVDVTATIKVLDTYNTDDVIAAVEAALQNYLTPATWSWASVLRYNELIALISNVPGVDYVADLSQPSADVTLPGWRR
jgi:phage-related baseplate assembly protein